MNELVGSVVLSILIGIILYFVIASKIKLGFDTSLMAAVPVILLVSLAVGALSPVMAFVTMMVGLMVAWVFNRLIGNR